MIELDAFITYDPETGEITSKEAMSFRLCYNEKPRVFAIEFLDPSIHKYIHVELDTLEKIIRSEKALAVKLSKRCKMFDHRAKKIHLKKLKRLAKRKAIYSNRREGRSHDGLKEEEANSYRKKPVK